jgi:predicted RNA-binding protein Jag
MDIQTYLSHICQHCGLDEETVTIEVTEDDRDQIMVQLDVPSDDVGLFIGNRGENLASLQRLMRIVFGEQFAEKKIILNINDYRQERQKQLEDKAVEAANYVLDTGRSYRFQFLSSYERFIVHSKISDNNDFTDLESISVGVGKQRRLVIQLKEGVEAKADLADNDQEEAENNDSKD